PPGRRHPFVVLPRPTLPLILEVSRPGRLMAATAAAALAAVFSPACALPRDRFAPKNGGTSVLLFVAAQGCGQRRAGFETSIEAAMGAAEINERRLKSWQPSAPSPRPTPASTAPSRPSA